MTIKVSFADLTHTGQIVSANTFPLGIMYIGAYAKQELKGEVEIELFKYPDDFNNYLQRNTPDIACFTTFTWNKNLAHEYAKRIKIFSPKTITVFGGVNFPQDSKEQRDYLCAYPAIDFFIDGEGEKAFVELYKALKRYDFDYLKFKKEHQETPSLRYLIDGRLIKAELMPRISNLDEIPSPYANGFSDKFFDSALSPMIQRTRGCPYSCTFCHEGSSRFSKVYRFSLSRIEWELDYLASRAKVPELFFVDLNFGMFKEDLDTAEYLAKIRKKWNWPQYLVADTAKNNKALIIKISKILKGALPPGASVQSTDPQVLKEIKRENLTLEHMVEIAKTRETDGASSRSEIILCLPGDTMEGHLKSVSDVMTAGISLLKTHQFMLLEGTEAASKDSREKYKMKTKFRVQPRCFGFYKFGNEVFHCAEIEEICVENSTMSYKDYEECRMLTLTTEIFNNDGLFYDLTQFLKLYKINQNEFIMSMHECTVNGDNKITEYYDKYLQEERANLWNSREALERHLMSREVIQEYIDGKYGNNELYKYRAIAVFENLDALHDIAYDVAIKLLKENNSFDDKVEQYLKELKQISYLRKKNFLKTDETAETVFHFDFEELHRKNFTINPFDVIRPEGITIRTFHNETQLIVAEGLIKQYGTSLVGLARILGRAKSIDLHRDVRLISR
ncbi:MAG: cobalamin-dependent protein [Candidatus Omnitrophica bacterium]|nr:cobalamin-dependent protein [Candidatus Omnitrophota bacterium]